MSEFFQPPQEYNARGDAMMPNYGYTPQGDPIMHRYNDRGDRLGDELGYTGTGDPYYFETTARGDIIPRGLDYRYFGDTLCYWDDEEDDWIEYEDDDDDMEDDPPELSHMSREWLMFLKARLAEIRAEETHISKILELWPAYERILTGKYGPDLADHELNAIDKENLYHMHIDDLKPFEDNLQALDALQEKYKGQGLEPFVVYQDARYLLQQPIDAGFDLYYPLSYEEWQKIHANFGTDPHFAEYVVSERYDEYVRYIAEQCGLKAGA